jgi:hypothetical protein
MRFSRRNILPPNLLHPATRRNKEGTNEQKLKREKKDKKMMGLF